MKFKKIAFFLIAAFLFFVSVVFYCNWVIGHSTKSKLYNDINKIPYNEVGLLLGTSKYIATNRINPYYAYRIEAAVQLLKAKKIKYIVVSGDNSKMNYNEPKMMRADLIKAGVDPEVIFLDYAGFRTFDSIIRLKKVFGQKKATVISQQFHNERAIYIATREDMDVIGFNAKDVSGSGGRMVHLREKLARLKVFLDFLFQTKPKFLGKKITIPAS